jgi:predicted Fe-S protein YdhL (DUF1289 family)
MKEQLQKGLSPCIGFCSTTYGDDYCRGCYRSFHEVIGWTSLTVAEKLNYFEKVSFLSQQLLEDKVDIFDQGLFDAGCKRYSIPNYPHLSPYYHLVLLMQKGYSRLINEEMGLRLINKEKKWVDLYKWVDQQLFKLIQSDRTT